MHLRLLTLAFAVLLLLSACTESGTGGAPPPPPSPAPATSQPATPRKPPETSQAALVKAIQTELIRLGFYTGSPDGMAGPKTRGAIGDYQKFRHLPVDGAPSQALLDQLKSS